MPSKKSGPGGRSSPPEHVVELQPSSAARTGADKAKKDRRGTPKGKGTIKRSNGSKIGNPKFEPTDLQRELVLSHAAVGTPQAIIAEELNISEDTLQRHFRKELDQGLARANSRLGSVLYKGALDGDTKKLEMWFDRRGGAEWQKKTGVELSGPGGGPVETITMQPKEFEERARRIASEI